jgi:hypothetical protein
VGTSRLIVTALSHFLPIAEIKRVLVPSFSSERFIGLLEPLIFTVVELYKEHTMKVTLV